MPQSLFDQLKQLYATKTVQGDSDTTLPTQRISAEAEPNALPRNQTHQTYLILFHGIEDAVECTERRHSYAHSLCQLD